MASVQDEPERLSRSYLRAISLVAMISLPSSAVLVVLAPDLVHVVLGEQWLDAVPALQLLAAVMLFRTSYKLSDTLARAAGAVYRHAWRQWAYGGAVFVGAVIGQAWGLAGVASGVGCAIVLNYFLMLHLSVRITKISWGRIGTVHLRHLTVAVVTVVPVWAVRHLMTLRDMPAGLVLVCGTFVAVLAVAGLWSATSRPFGEEGHWAMSIVKRYGRHAAARIGVL